MILAVVIAWCFVAIAGDYLLKHGHFWYGMAVYASCAVPGFFTFHRREFGNITVLWAAVSVPVGLACSVFLCDEPLTRRRIIGALLAVTAIAITE